MGKVREVSRGEEGKEIGRRMREVNRGEERKEGERGRVGKVSRGRGKEGGIGEGDVHFNVCLRKWFGELILVKQINFNSLFYEHS